MTSLLSSAFVYLGAAVLIVPMSKRLGLGSVYLLAGEANSNNHSVCRGIRHRIRRHSLFRSFGRPTCSSRLFLCYCF